MRDYAAGTTVYFWAAANDTSGSGADGASEVYDVRKGGDASGAAPTASGSMTLLSHANYGAGLYEIAIDTTGFAAGYYAVFCTALVDSQNPAGLAGEFSIDTPARAATVTNADKTGYDLNADQSAVTVGTVNTLNGHTAQTGDSYALANGANGFVALKSDTALIVADWADGGRLDTILDAAAAQFATAMAESYAAQGATRTPAQAMYEILALLTRFAIASTTLTIKKLDGSTTAKTYTLSDATNPTSLTEAT